MTYYIRRWYNIWYYNLFNQSTRITDNFYWKSRVYPKEVDTSLCVQDSAFLILAGYARWGWFSSTSLNAEMKKRKLTPIITQVSVQYLSKLHLFSDYTIKTRLMHINEKAFFVHQKFIFKEKIICVLLFKMHLQDEKGIVNPFPVFESLLKGDNLPTNMEGMRNKQGLDIFYSLESYLLEKPVLLHL